ncbi:hypothetical protein V1477_010897 [Vespula maculifrons]|uniref:Uncharacterized protein n=1 Tax=Vespula maculifrons TaxID=7453 RepID=A0ABD2C388_VESMC
MFWTLVDYTVIILVLRWKSREELFRTGIRRVNVLRKKEKGEKGKMRKEREEKRKKKKEERLPTVEKPAYRVTWMLATLRTPHVGSREQARNF